jgi:hypothetical protein
MAIRTILATTVTRLTLSRLTMTNAPRWTRNGFLVATLLASGTVFGCSPRTIVLAPISATFLRTPSDRDEFFNIVAVNFQEPALCDRIDTRADGSTGGWDSPYRIRRLRSVCRDDVKEKTITVPHPPMPWFAAQVRTVGYSDADVVQAAWDENPFLTPTYDRYKELLANEVFRSRVRAARSYDEPRDPGRLRPARPVEFLYQMVAIDRPEADLCSKVSPNATVRDRGGATARLQVRCYLHIAFNTRDLGLCEALPANGSFPYPNERYESREQCRETVAIYRRPDFKSGLTYGPTLFPRAADLPAILSEIGYREGELVPLAPAAKEYWEFVVRLKYRGSPADKAEFVRRVEALK